MQLTPDFHYYRALLASLEGLPVISNSAVSCLDLEWWLELNNRKGN